MKTIKALVAGLSLMLAGLLAATFHMGWRCGQLAGWPFQIHQWYLHCAAATPEYQFHSMMIFLTFSLAGGLAGAFFQRQSRIRTEFGASKWATLEDVKAAGLIMQPGQRSRLIHVLGKFAGQFLTYTGDTHLLICGGNRSGKGRSSGIPTLLSLASSIVVHDSKGELFFGNPRHSFVGTAGFRAKLLGQRVIYFNPKDRKSARYNPLMMIRRGDNEVADMQRLILILFGRAPKDFWEKGGGRMLLAIGLHVLYGEPDSEKSLTGMSRLLDRGDEGLERIISASAHPLAVRAARGFFPGGVGSRDSDRTRGMRAGLNFTARDFLSFYDDPVTEFVTSGLCDFEPADLVRHDNGTSLYLVPPPDDQDRAAPLLNLIVSQILADLVSHEHGRLDRTATGHPKNHHTVLFLDEMAGLGRMDDLVKKLPQMPGYGVTAMMFIQSISQLDEVYTSNIASTIIDNCGVSVWYAAADPRTGQRISSMIGNATEIEKTVSTSRPAGAIFGGITTLGEREIHRPVMDAGAVRELPGDTELVFVNGAKPIKARKLQYDREPTFTARLFPAPPIGNGKGNYPDLTPIPSPWSGLFVPEAPQAPADQPERADQGPDPEALTFEPDDWMAELEATR